jgi:hypothetical protein
MVADRPKCPNNSTAITAPFASDTLSLANPSRIAELTGSRRKLTTIHNRPRDQRMGFRARGVLPQLLQGSPSEVKREGNDRVALNSCKPAPALSLVQRTGTPFPDRLFGWVGLAVVVSIMGLNVYLVVRYLL